MATLITDITAFMTAFVGWFTTVINDMIVETPVILIFVMLAIVGTIIGFARRMIRGA